MLAKKTRLDAGAASAFLKKVRQLMIRHDAVTGLVIAILPFCAYWVWEAWS